MWPAVHSRAADRSREAPRPGRKPSADQPLMDCEHQALPNASTDGCQRASFSHAKHRCAHAGVGRITWRTRAVARITFLRARINAAQRAALFFSLSRARTLTQPLLLPRSRCAMRAAAVHGRRRLQIINAPRITTTNMRVPTSAPCSDRNNNVVAVTMFVKHDEHKRQNGASAACGDARS